MTQPTEGESLKMCETDEGSMSLSGTFFCEMTTAQSLPRTPRDVMFAAVIALKAYSVGGRQWGCGGVEGGAGAACIPTW